MARRPVDQTERDRIRDELDATLFIEAGAGTGKTHELIERIVRLVASGHAELRHIAAITFTEAAAAELRDRVRERLEEAARDEQLSTDEVRRCAAAITEIDAAAIETVHGFAQRVLAAHPLEAGLPPIVEIQDETQAWIAFEERWSAFLEQFLNDASMEEVLLRAFTLGLRPEHLREVAWEFQQNWDRLADSEILPAPLAAGDPGEVLQRLDEACAAMSDCINPQDLLYQHLEGVDPYRRRLHAATAELDLLRVLAEPAVLKRRVGRKEHWRHLLPDHIRDLLEDAHDRREELLGQARAGVLPALLSSLRRFILDYADERRREGRLEFHDLLVRARDLLRNNSAVRGEVRAQFSHLLIDEFQDTDPLQIEIAVLIAGKETSDPPPPWREAEIEEGRLFFVGDPKQSIYRFRRADIALHRAAQQRFSRQTVRLTQNFRSLPPVIDWVNDMFSTLMADGGTESQAEYVPLQASRTPGRGARTVVRHFGGPVDDRIEAIREREADDLARLIQTAKLERWPVSDTKTDHARFADIAILMPARTTLPPIEHALEVAGIPYRVESRSLVFDTQEVRELLSILRAIDDPTDQVALVAALRSPAFGCSDNDLLRYARTPGTWDYRRDPPNELPEDDPVGAAMRALRDLYQRRWWETISGIVEAVVRERRLFELAFAYQRPRERWQRLRFILDQARGFAEAGGRTLRQFIDWAERQAEEGTRVIETAVPEPDDDAVRIMTIHAAKGLEFPIVMLAGLNLSGARHTTDASILWHADGRPEARIGLAGAFETPGYGDLADYETHMERDEKVRLLYVAATRARDHLVVSLYHKQGQESHAARLHELALDSPDVWQATVPQWQTPMKLPVPVPFDDSPERREAWLEQRARNIESLTRAARRSATEIASRAGGGADDPNLQKDAPLEEEPPWRRGRAGTAIGRAVHAVLQSIDLATGENLESAARAQAAAEGIAPRSREIARMVRGALDAPSVREATGGGRYWRELYVSAPVDGTVVEGFVDLLYETSAGLVVVDYKTDVLPTAGELDDAMARYRLQGAAYALALEEALGQPVTRCVFVFVQPREAQERAIEDLPAAIAAVRAELSRTE